MRIHLTDGSIEELEEGSSGIDLAKKIKSSLVGPALASFTNQELHDLSAPLKDGDQVEILTFEHQLGKELFWHSSAHLLAQAITRLFPKAEPSIGPAIEEGFYYDFANLTLSEDDFSNIEAEIRKIVKKRFIPQRIEYSTKEEAIEQVGFNKFKVEMIEKLDEGLSAYKQGEYIDLCKGPHVPHLGLIQAFKIMRTSGAYWRADSNNDQLTRVYGVSYPEKKMLKRYLRFLEEAKKRDHRILGRKLNLFSFHEEAPGMPFFHPKGMLIWRELMTYWQEEHQKENYLEIKTPVMMTRELWEKSGHWQNYRENMYTSEIDDRSFAIKPMNCPGCVLYFKEGQYSYRQLPIRIAEVGNVHRHELNGALSGLFRVRSFHQDDSHIFMKPEDIRSEILHVIKLSEKIYSTFGLDFHLELSTRPEKSIGSHQQWEQATKGLQEALDDSGYKYIVNEGDGAFYGPKIDIHIKDVIGRTWQCATIQLDMMLPERFDVNYTTKDGHKERPIMIHRVIFGSIERFLGILVEHFTGRFPLWLSPVQIRILTVADRHLDYAEELKSQFRNAKMRCEIDDAAESIGRKVRNAQLDQVNYILVVGDQELESGKVTVRTRANQVLGAMEMSSFLPIITKEYQTRSIDSLLKQDSN